jgi:PhoPQ-activated pathogenicity-related protein
MVSMLSSLFRRVVLAAALLGLAVSPVQAGLLEYVKKPEPKFAWKLKEKTVSEGATVYDIELTSQEWQKIVWKHQLQVYQPKDVKPNATMLVYNTGGTAKVDTILFGMDLAKKVQAPVAILYGIPNQPIFDKKEDALIAETFVRYLDTKDEDWPLLFPMVKSVVKAMDALQAFSKEEWKTEIKSFIISGASKRGWTAWLTGASDARVKAIAPLVIDTLSMLDQLKHQKESFGDYSEMIHDYVERGLAPIPKTAMGLKLWEMVDPYFYRDRLTMPKLLINGNNDPYWTVDALNLYWKGLKGDKYVTYVPNAGHDLRQGGKDGDRTRAVNALAAFARCQIADKAMPKLLWKHDDDKKGLRLTITADVQPKAARFWVATAKTRDFRKSEWKEQQVELGKGSITGLVTPPEAGFLAFYGELDYEIDGIKYTLSTQIRVAGKEK